MKQVRGLVLMFTFCTAGLYAQETPIQMTLSGTAAPSTVNLKTGTGVSEYTLAGKGTLGQFTLRAVSASTASPQPSATCSGLYFPTLAGEGVFRFQDGSLLNLMLTEGSDCIDLTTKEAFCTRVFQILGGTGRFKDASGGTITVTETVAPVVPTVLGFFTVTGEVTGEISGVGDANGARDR